MSFNGKGLKFESLVTCKHCWNYNIPTMNIVIFVLTNFNIFIVAMSIFPPMSATLCSHLPLA